MTPHQHRLWRIIARSIETRRFAPTLEEMADEMGQGSRSGMREMVLALARQGVIRHYPGRNRGIKLLREPPSNDICVIRIDRAGKSDVWLSGDVREPLSFREIRTALDHAAQAIEGAALRRREGLAS